jgi:cytochrome c oxidase cbb3-type subunit II
MTQAVTTPPRKTSLWAKHKIFETNSIFLILGVLFVISIGGLVEIAPLFYLQSTIERVKGFVPTHRSNWPDAPSMSARVATTATAR